MVTKNIVFMHGIVFKFESVQTTQPKTIWNFCLCGEKRSWNNLFCWKKVKQKWFDKAR